MWSEWLAFALVVLVTVLLLARTALAPRVFRATFVAISVVLATDIALAYVGAPIPASVRLAIRGVGMVVLMCAVLVVFCHRGR